METSSVEVEPGGLYLGPVVDPVSGDPVGDDKIIYEAADLTTHGVIVGMTGSGKTGLGICLLEEALLQGIPALVIDPKGDMGNLLLAFPDLAPSDFRPWINEGQAKREGVEPDDLASSTAAMWESGLAGSGVGKDRLSRFANGADFTIYTPGSRSGVSLNIVGDMAPPPGSVDPEALQDEIDGLVQGLLGLVGVRSDPLSGREHVLLANLVSNAWANGKSMDLPQMIAQVQDPPMRKLGVIQLDTFFPPSDRVALAMKLNGLLASPAFASWGEGESLDIDSMLHGTDGRPRAAIVSIAHLSDDERQFVVALVLSKLVTWMRSQPGTPDLRALVYMDEVFGFVPPTAEPPAKRPILTILKQARAFGVGMVLSTQNPVDLDYKALSNAGTWMVGRLQTERDKARLLEGMRSAGGDVDISAIGDLIGSLGKRKFLLHTTRGGAPTTFGTRWAMSYLPGPLTRDQISVLMDTRRGEHEVPAEGASPAAATPAEGASPAPAAGTPAAGTPSARTPSAQAAAAAPSPTLADDETIVAPKIADGVPVAFADPAAEWASTFGAQPGGRRLVAALACRVRLLFDETVDDLRHESEWEAVASPLMTVVGGDDFVQVDYDDRDLRREPPENAVYVVPEAKIHTKTFFTKTRSSLKDRIYREQTLQLYRNRGLKLYSRVGETKAEFEDRCQRAADDRADDEADKLRQVMAKKQDRVRAAMNKAEDRIRELEADAKDRKQNEMLSGALDLVGGLLGGRKRSRSLLGGLRRASGKRRMSSNASQRVETAQNRLEENIDKLEDLADVLEESLAESRDEWDEVAATIEDREVALEKADITIEDLHVVWIPTG